MAILIIILLMMIICNKLITSRHPHCNIRLPPSPPSLPLIGHIHHLLLTSQSLHKCFHNLSSKYGPLIVLRFGSYPLILISSASLASQIFKTHDLNFSSRPRSPLHDSLLFGDFGFVTAPYGEYWRFMKKLCVTKLLSQRQLDRSRSVRREELLRFLKKMAEKGLKEESVDLGGELMTLTNNTTCRMAMRARCSTECGNEAERCRELVKESLNLTAKMAVANMFGPLRNLVRLLFRKQAMDVPAQYDALLEGILKEHEARPTRDAAAAAAVDDDDDGDGTETCEDLMDILLQVSNNANADIHITRRHIKAFFLDLFIAGTSTTADTMEWTMAELLNHPIIFNKVREEINAVTGKSCRLVEEADIAGLHYLEAVVKETLRLHPPAVIAPRECGEDCKIGGFDIPKGVAVAINVFSVMRDPEVWVDPNEFRPERFVHDDGRVKGTVGAGAGVGAAGFIPFGGGRRMCPGSAMALSLICCTVAAMVQCFDWELENGEDTVSMEATSGFNMSLAQPLLCLPVIRFNTFKLHGDLCKGRP
ncbi:Cytochrome P450 705A20 [Linum perenne]